ncbi:hypothetical protein J4Q44_G00270640 [Coregonus suidteri]|uniref:B30.2/SPRY domain-containing protein n=1 Tax=Coregonus suidteri TaxID=861788 RepID=A0AAN8KX02_9TELE
MDPIYKQRKVNVDHGGECMLKSGPKIYACQLILDPNTTNPNLLLSEGNRKVTWVEGEEHYEDHLDRFDYHPQVLCRESLSRSRFYWEVEWHSGNTVIGVVYKGISRKSEGWDSRIGANRMSWSLYCSDNGYYFYHAGLPRSPIPGCVSHRVGVYLDWPAGTLSFYSVSSSGELNHIHTYYTTFTEPVYPGFRIYKDSSLSLCHLE